jgi:hypothetical protein
VALPPGSRDVVILFGGTLDASPGRGDNASLGRLEPARWSFLKQSGRFHYVLVIVEVADRAQHARLGSFHRSNDCAIVPGKPQNPTLAFPFFRGAFV